jgi:hypothetical protein
MISTVTKLDSSRVFFFIVCIKLSHMQELVMLRVPKYDLLVMANSSDYLHFRMMSQQHFVPNSL